MNVVGNNAAFITTILGIAGLVAVGLGIYWHFNRQAKRRDLAVLRKKLDELEPSDPEYNAARALYTSMMIDAERWDFFHSYAGSDGHSSSSDHHGGGSDDSGGGSYGGGGHH